MFVLGGDFHVKKKCGFSTKSPFSAPFSEEIQQGQGEEAETPGGAGGDGCRLRQGGGSQQGERPPSLKNGAKKGKISPAASKPCPPFNFLGCYLLLPSSKTPSKPSRCSKNTTATGECPPPGYGKTVVVPPVPGGGQRCLFWPPPPPASMSPSSADAAPAWNRPPWSGLSS